MSPQTSTILLQEVYSVAAMGDVYFLPIMLQGVLTRAILSLALSFRLSFQSKRTAISNVVTSTL